MRKKTGQIGCIFLVLTLLCTGCAGESTQEIPELVEPAAVNSAYRMVSYGDVGDIEILYGTVVPTDYCQFYTTNTAISEIVVEVGETVKKGDILAYADTKAAQEELSKLREELAYENETYRLNSEIAQKEMEQSEDQSQTKVLQENARYDGLLHEYRVSKLEESIAQKQEIMDDGVLYASHAGSVTYTKNIAADRNAGAMENIVVISDEDEPVIELDDETVYTYAYEDYELKYIKAAGEKLAVTEISYTSDELILAKAAGQYPKVRFECPTAEHLVLGENYAVYFQEEDVQNVLMVGNDSVSSDEDGTLVYVRAEDGTKERREIEIGAKDDNYSEVLSGLSEGELVYYESKSVIPADDSTYQVKLSDFEIYNYSGTYELAGAFALPCTSEYEGTVTEIAVSEEQQIAEGDLLYIIDTGEGLAAITETKNQISRENASYQETIKNLDEQQEALEQSGEQDTGAALFVLSLERELAKVEHEYNLRGLNRTLESLESNNDGTGKISVYATLQGQVSKICVSEGDRVETGDELLDLTVEAGDMLLVQMAPVKQMATYEDNIADVGEIVSISVGETTYTGTCIGWTVGDNNEDKVYLSSDDTRAYLSYGGNSGYSYPAFWVQMEDESFYEDMPNGIFTFCYISMKDGLCVSVGCADLGYDGV